MVLGNNVNDMPVVPNGGISYDTINKGSPRANSSNDFLRTILEKRLDQPSHWKDLLHWKGEWKCSVSLNPYSSKSDFLVWTIYFGCLLTIYGILADYLTSLDLYFLIIKRGMNSNGIYPIKVLWELTLIANRVFTMCQAFLWEFFK